MRKVSSLFILAFATLCLEGCNILVSESKQATDPNFYPGVPAVNPVAPTLSYAGADGTSGIQGTAMSVSPTTLNANGSAITGCAIKAGTTALPTWATLNTLTCVISGTPTATQSATTYTINATNVSGTSADATVALTVAAPAAPSSLSYSAPTAIYVYNDQGIGVYSAALTSSVTNTPAITGYVQPNGYSVVPALPTGLSIDANTGVISGKPSVTTAATNYTVTAVNAGGSTSAVISIRTGPGFLVDSTADDADAASDDDCDGWANATRVCTLRAALGQINTWASATTYLVVVPAGTITITSQISFSKNIEMIGNSQATTILDGDTGNYTLLSFTTGTSTIADLSLRNATRGMAISGSATLTLNGLKFSDFVGGNGGGLSVSTGTLNVNRCTFSSNQSVSGGAIYANGPGAIVNITDSYFDLNSANLGGLGGGAIWFSSTGASGGTLSISGSLFEHNGATFSAAVIYLSGAGAKTITNSTLSQNGVYDAGLGLYLAMSPLIYNQSGTLTMTNCTVADNVMGGPTTYAIRRSSGTLSIVNSIVANNRFGAATTNCTGTITNGGNNLSDDASCNFGSGNNTDPLLDALADNGGYTMTMALQTGSPAINAGNDASCTSSYDQRGSGYSRIVGTNCDIGAYEKQ